MVKHIIDVQNKRGSMDDLSLSQKIIDNGERPFRNSTSKLDPFEILRYGYTTTNSKGANILEIGCGTGYGLRFLKSIQNLNYMGYDYDKETLKFAQKEFGNIEGVKFKRVDLECFDAYEMYDTIIAFEVFEHLENGKELYKKLKNHCKQLFFSVPYRENEMRNKFHKLYNLVETDFPADFYKYYILDREIWKDTPTKNSILWLFGSWSK